MGYDYDLGLRQTKRNLSFKHGTRNGNSHFGLGQLFNGSYGISPDFQLADSLKVPMDRGGPEEEEGCWEVRLKKKPALLGASLHFLSQADASLRFLLETSV